MKKFVGVILVLWILQILSLGYGYESPNHPQAYFYFLKGLLAEKDGNYRQALEDYKMALQYDPKPAALHSQLGSIYAQLGEPDRAIGEAEQAIASEKDYLPGYFLLAAIYTQQGKFPEAIEVYKKITQLKPDQALGFFMLGSLYLGTRDYDGAVASFEKVVTLVPEYIDGYFNLGFAYQSLEKWEQAIKQYEKVLSLEAENINAYFSLADVYEKKNETDQAINQYRKILELNPKNLVAHYRLGVLYYQKHNLEESLLEFKTLQNLFPEDISSSFYLAIIYEEKQDFEQAISYYNKVLASLKKITSKNKVPKETKELTIPAVSGIYLHLGYIYLKQNRINKAIAILEKAKALDSNNISLNYFLVLAYGETKKYRKALNLLQQTITLKESRPGVSLTEKSEPTLDELYFRLGVIYDQIKDWVKAEKQFRKAIQINPQHAGSLNYLGYTFADQGLNLDEAEMLVKRALAMEPHNGAYLDSLGWIYYKKGYFNESWQLLQQAIEVIKEDAVIFEHLGEVALRLGKKEQTLKYWQNSLKINKNNKALRKKMDSLLIQR